MIRYADIQFAMKAIATNFCGTRFRSRLEARWAAFFDAMGIEFEYETVGLELPNLGHYWPDFIFNNPARFAEVKPVWPTGLEVAKVRACAALTKIGSVVLIGPPDLCAYWMILPDGSETAILMEKHFPLADDCFIRPTDGIYFNSQVWNAPSKLFSREYRQAVEDCHHLRFDGYDRDRATIRNRYR